MTLQSEVEEEQCQICDNIFAIKKMIQMMPHHPEEPWFRCCIDCAGEIAESMRDTGCSACMMVAMTLDRLLAAAVSAAPDDSFIEPIPHDIPHLPDCPIGLALSID